jgi:hypothetical protein
MMSSDAISLVFSTSGVASVIGALNNVANAQDRVTLANIRAAKAAGKSGEYAALVARATAQRGQAATNFQSAVMGAAQAFTAIGHLVSGVREAIDAYADFGRKVREVMQMTGSTSREAAFAVNLGRAAGIPDAKEIQEMLKVAKGFGATGGATQGALLRLGISGSDAAGGGVAVFNKVIDRLGAMQDGLRKTALEEQIFGVRGAVAMQDILALTKEQRQAVTELSDAYDGRGVAAAQRFQAGLAILGMTIEQKIVFPLAAKLIPTLQLVIGWIGKAATAFVSLDHMMGGYLGTLLLVVAAFSALAVAVVSVIALGKAFVGVLRSIAIGEMLIDALQGPKGWAIIAGAIAVVGGATYGMNRLMDSGGDTATNANTSATNANTAALNLVNDNLSTYAGLPKGLGFGDVLAIAQRQAALGAIG